MTPRGATRAHSSEAARTVDVRDLDALVDEMRTRAGSSRAPLRVIAGYLARTQIPALVADDAGAYIGANTAAVALTGFSRAELLRRTVADLTAPHDAHVEPQLWHAFVRSDHQRGHYGLLRKDGAVVEVRYDAYARIAPGMHVSFVTRRQGARTRR